MTKENYLKDAFCTIFREIDPTPNISDEHFELILYRFSSASETADKGSAIIYQSLSNTLWNWKNWKKFANAAGYDSLESIKTSMEKLSNKQIAKSLRVAELTSLCKSLGITIPTRFTKSKIIDFLINSIPEPDLAEALYPFKSRLWEKRNEECRKNMAIHLASRITSIVYHKERYHQLSHPDLLKIRPYWKFVWAGASDPGAPRSCRKFDGKIRQHFDAIKIYPQLPCAFIQCGCYIVAVAKNSDR